MLGLKMMMIDNGTAQVIRCRFISEWYKVDTYASDNGQSGTSINKQVCHA